MARTRNREQPMSAEARRRLIEAPISIQTWGSAGKSHGGCDLRPRRHRGLVDEMDIESRLTPEDYRVALVEWGHKRRHK